MISYREGLLEREKEIMKILNIFLEQNLNFIVVGGYAVSTYKKRFSIDLDLVIKEEDFRKFGSVLQKNKYLLNYEKKIALTYGEKFIRFLKKLRGLPVNIDILINGLVSRTTNSTWSFDYIKKHSNKRMLNDLEFLTPKRELIIAMKFHAGRLSDIRDIVALMPCDDKKLRKHILRGDIKSLKNILKKYEEFLTKPQFDDSFKGIFGIHVYKHENVEQTKQLIKNLLK